MLPSATAQLKRVSSRVLSLRTTRLFSTTTHVPYATRGPLGADEVDGAPELYCQLHDTNRDIITRYSTVVCVGVGRRGFVERERERGRERERERVERELWARGRERERERERDPAYNSL